MFSDCGGMPALYIYYGFVWVAVLLVRLRTTGVLFSFLVRDFSAFSESESAGTFDSKSTKLPCLIVSVSVHNTFPTSLGLEVIECRSGCLLTLPRIPYLVSRPFIGIIYPYLNS